MLWKGCHELAVPWSNVCLRSALTIGEEGEGAVGLLRLWRRHRRCSGSWKLLEVCHGRWGLRVLEVGGRQLRHGWDWLHEVTRCQVRSISGSIGSSVGRRRHSHRRSGLVGQLGAEKDGLLQFRKRHSLSRVQIKDSSQDVIKIIREGKDRLEEAAILHVGAESGIIHGSPLPRVATTGQVDQDNTKRPNIIGGRGVASIRARV